jgi:hypothetical protein
MIVDILNIIKAQGGDSSGKSNSLRPRRARNEVEEAEALPAESVRLKLIKINKVL